MHRLVSTQKQPEDYLISAANNLLLAKKHVEIAEEIKQDTSIKIYEKRSPEINFYPNETRLERLDSYSSFKPE